MLNTIKTQIQFSKYFDVVFINSSSLFFIKGLNGFVILKLPSVYFSKYFVITHFFLLFINSFYYKMFMKTLYNSYGLLFSFYVFKLKLRGLGFRVKKICKFLYRFFFTFTNFFYLHIPSNVLLKIKKRRLFFLSNSNWVLRTLILNILLLKNIGVYFLRGLVYPREIIIMKPGKKRF